MVANENQAQPILILVTGAPGSGKTTIAARLATDLRLPLFAKDDIKELLADVLDVSGYEWSKRVGKASFFVIDELAARLLMAGESLILESNFDASFQEEWSFLRAARANEAWIIEVFCHADVDVVLRRYADRLESGQRHPIHVDRIHLQNELIADRVREKFGAPLHVGTTIEVDTTSFERVDYFGILARVQSIIDHPNMAQPRE